MLLILSFMVLAVLPLMLKAAVFESVVSLFLLTPVIAFLFGNTMGLNTGTYLLSLIILCTAFTLIFRRRDDAKDDAKQDVKSELIPVAVFAVSFIFFHRMCLLWPDYIAMGERLRDFAILSSVIQSPVALKEPWMDGFSLNYYAFWYRYGHFLSTMYGLETWEVYNTLQSFTFALYLTSAFVILRRHMSFNILPALFFSTLIAIGSNVSGIVHLFTGNDSWWGPSRVIPGAINEFPAWSFLLGDLHPHYLNLPLLPFFIVLLLATKDSLTSLFSYAIVLFCGITLFPVWIYNANAWDFPVWMGMFACIGLLSLVSVWRTRRSTEKPPPDIFNFKIGYRQSLIFLIAALATYSLYLSQINIQPVSYPVDFVKDPIPRTLTPDFIQHFGIPLFLIAASLLILMKDSFLRTSAFALFFTLIFFPEVVWFLAALLLVNTARIWAEYRLPGRDENTFGGKAVIIESIGLSALGLLILPEVVFLNDPYGAEIERMNTIFKIYSVNWFFIHLFAFYLAAKATSGVSFFRFRYAWAAAGLIVFIYCTGFYFRTGFKLRKIAVQDILPREQGLSEINRIFPGAAAAIQKLQKMERGTVLEAQGKPYDYTTHVATLSENQSFLGWANHVNLLLNNNPEIQRREKLSDDFYNSAECAQKSDIMRARRIKYAVLGPLEKRRHPRVSPENFSCLKEIIREGEYRIYSLPD